MIVDGVWKSYRIYHHRSHTLKERVLSRGNRFEELWVLKDISLEVPAGTTFGIIGANGSGKSTLLKTMARILTPNRGSVEVRGRISSLLELGIGFHPELSGRENVFLSCSISGMTRRDVEARYADIVDFAGIEDFMDMPVKNYSTGMYARLAFSVAVSVEPEILVVDEVLSVGDESFQMRCYDRIAQFRSDGRTIVLVTHSLETIRTLCDGAAWIHEGALQQIGEPLDVVAGYLGEVHGSASHPAEVAATHQRFGTGEVVVTGVVLRDAVGKETSVVRNGEPMTVTVCYQAEQPIHHVVCSIAIYRADTLAYVFGQTSRQGGLSLDLTHQGIIEFAVGQLPLLAGHYLLSVALLDEATHRPYDWHERGYSMMVFDNPALPGQAGLVRVDGLWSASEVDPSLVADETTGRTPEATVA